MATEQGYETQSVEKSIDVLNGFLRGEISAVETYRMAIEKITETYLQDRLRELSQSHQNRAARLRSQIAQLGGEPADSSGAWGGFAKLIEGGAKVFGVKSALAALEEGEDHGLRQYRDEIDKLDSTLRTVVETEFLPEQQRSHDTMSSLKHSVH